MAYNEEHVIESLDVKVVDSSESCVPIPDTTLATSHHLDKVSSDLGTSSHGDLFPSD